MRLAISNIAWDRHDDPDILALLRAHGVTGIEVAPSKVWPGWEGATPAAAADYRRRMADEGFAIPSLQAILFGRPELVLFGTDEQRRGLTDHLTYVADLAAALGARALVFGAPKARDRGALSLDAAMDLAAPVFARIGAECAERGVCLCLEPNPPQYACNFGVDSDEAARLVAAVDSPGFRLHLDSAALRMVDEDAAAAVRRHAPLTAHVHASEPELGPFTAPQSDHAGFAAALAEVGYSGWVSIEMRACAPQAETIARACSLVREAYAPVFAKQRETTA